MRRRLRLDAVDELITNDNFAHNVDECLSKLPKDLDKCGAPTSAVPAVLRSASTVLCASYGEVRSCGWCRVCSSFAMRPVKAGSNPIR
jgi:hypothetical protein